MKNLLLFFSLVVFSASGWGYEFVVSSLNRPIGKAAPKQVLVRKTPAAVVFLKTTIINLEDMSDSTIQQDKVPGGYVLYVAPKWPARLWLTAPGFVSKVVELGSLPSNSVWEITVSTGGKNPRLFNLSVARLSFNADPTNATAATSQTYMPEIWINTDASFSQIQGLLKEGGYTVISNTMAPYRVSPKKKKAKAGDVLSPAALSKLGDVAKMPLEERAVYNLDIKW